MADTGKVRSRAEEECDQAHNAGMKEPQEKRRRRVTQESSSDDDSDHDECGAPSSDDDSGHECGAGEAPRPLKRQGELLYEVEEIVKERIVNDQAQVKVKWSGYEEMTWEPKTEMTEDVLRVWCAKQGGQTAGAQKSTPVRMTRASNPHPEVQRIECVWTLQGAHKENEWVPTDLVAEIRGQIADPFSVADAENVNCSRGMDLDEVLTLAPFQHWMPGHMEERHRQLPLAHTDVGSHHKRLRSVLNHLAKEAKAQYLKTGSLSPCAFAGYLVLVNSETERIISISHATPKDVWVGAFRDKAKKTVATGGIGKQHIITSAAGLQVTEADFFQVCEEVQRLRPAWDGHLLYES